MENTICEMYRAEDVWPANINTASVLWINQPCDSSLVYNLICDRRNIVEVHVSGRKYSHQEIRNMAPGVNLGGSGLADPYPAEGGIGAATVPVPPIFGEWPVVTEMAMNDFERELRISFTATPPRPVRPTLAQVNENAARVYYQNITATLEGADITVDDTYYIP